ncbi:DnaJ domain-containing protein [Pararhizobium sp. LjRoot235]|uniref:DnaJ C-terminal domain-containing protein n=1 Tax=Pararhizobium sp. LjRoot235 TaxID=3342291 RepID=UPI003ECE0374
MRHDPYDILGVKRDATQKDIQSAFRKLAKKHHPDLNPGDRPAEERFKEISTAYELLSDEEKRARFDRGEIDISGAEQAPRHYYRDYASASGPSDPYHNSASFADFGETEDPFSAFFSRRTSGGQFRSKGQDRYFSMAVDFLDAVNGAKNHVMLPDGTALEVQIPAGTRDGQTLRLGGKGEPGVGGGPPGDALIEVHVRPHRFFQRDGDDIRLELPITLNEAVLGAKIRAPTPTGPVTLTVPPYSNSGKVLRLKDKGAPKRGGGRGDLFVTLKIVLPDTPDPRLTAFIKEWSEASRQDPRKSMGTAP